MMTVGGRRGGGVEPPFSLFLGPFIFGVALKRREMFEIQLPEVVAEHIGTGL